MLPTLGEVLAMDVCRRGRPHVVACADRLDQPVRWVHAVELTDVARLLRGGELVLSTGIALPDDDKLLADYVTELAGVGVTGLAVELGRRYAGSLPGALVAAASQAGLPLIAFEREVPFIEITEAVHARIIDAQLEELRVSERLHEMFTELSVAGASAEEIVRRAAGDPGRPVAPGAGLLARRGRPRPAAERLRRAEPGGFGAAGPGWASGRPNRVRRGLGMAGDPGRRARRGLGPGHPGLRRPA